MNTPTTRNIDLINDHVTTPGPPDAPPHALADATERLRLNPDHPQAWRALGDALAALRRHQPAAEAYAKALELSPADARLYTRLGRCMVHLGRESVATACFNKALTLDPGAMSALKGLAGLQVIPLHHPLVREMVRTLEEGLVPIETLAAAAFLLGQITFQAGRLQEAFDHYQRGNAFMRAAQSQGASEPDWLAMRALDRACIAAARARINPPAQATPPVVLVAGLPRSGKSLVESLLASHADFVPGGELAGLLNVVGERGADPLARAAALSDRDVVALAAVYEADRARQATADQVGARVIVDTSPGNLACLGFLGVLAPDVPVVLCERDPLDLGAALYFKKFRSGHAYSYDLERLGTALAHAETLIAHWAAVLPNPVLRIRYEEMALAPTETRHRLLRFLGRDPAGGKAPPTSPGLPAPPAPESHSAQAANPGRSSRLCAPLARPVHAHDAGLP